MGTNFVHDSQRTIYLEPCETSIFFFAKFSLKSSVIDMWQVSNLLIVVILLLTVNIFLPLGQRHPKFKVCF